MLEEYLVLTESRIPLKDIQILAIIVVPLVMTLSTNQKDSHNEMIMASLQGQ